jgi:hypothetical protein
MPALLDIDEEFMRVGHMRDSHFSFSFGFEYVGIFMAPSRQASVLGPGVVFVAAELPHCVSYFSHIGLCVIFIHLPSAK